MLLLSAEISPDILSASPHHRYRPAEMLHGHDIAAKLSPNLHLWTSLHGEMLNADDVASLDFILMH